MRNIRNRKFIKRRREKFQRGIQKKRLLDRKRNC